MTTSQESKDRLEHLADFRPSKLQEIQKDPEAPKLWGGKVRVKRREKNSGKVRYYAEKRALYGTVSQLPKMPWTPIEDTTDDAHLHKDIGDAVAVADAYFKKLIKSDEVVME